MLTFLSLVDALRAGWRVYDRDANGYILRRSSMDGKHLELARVTCKDDGGEAMRKHS